MEMFIACLLIIAFSLGYLFIGGRNQKNQRVPH